MGHSPSALDPRAYALCATRHCDPALDAGVAISSPEQTSLTHRDCHVAPLLAMTKWVRKGTSAGVAAPSIHRIKRGAVVSSGTEICLPEHSRRAFGGAVLPANDTVYDVIVVGAGNAALSAAIAAREQTQSVLVVEKGPGVLSAAATPTSPAASSASPTTDWTTLRV